MNKLIFLPFSAVAFASRYLCQFKVSLPTFFSKKVGILFPRQGRYELEMNVRVGIEDMEIEIEIVRNDAGFGIYNLDIDT